MSNTSPPKPWQVSTTNKATSLNPTNSSQALSTISSTSNGRLKPWEREASVTQGTKAAQVSDISSLQQSSSMSSLSSAAANSSSIIHDDMGPSSRYGPNRNVGYGSGANDMYGNDRYGSSSSYGGVGGVGGVGGYGSSSYGSGYGSSYGGYGSGYGSSYGGGYGSGYGSYGGGYGSSYGSGGYGGGYGGYGSSYGSGYGSSYGGYGSSYGGYGSSYGGYGSSYGSGGYYGGGGGLFGGAGGNPQWAKYGPPAAGYLDWRGAADQGFRWVDGFHHVTAGFGRFVGLLDANSQAMHGALSSIVRLIENAGLLYREIGLAISGFTLFRLIQRIFQRILGSKSSKLNAHPSDAVVNEFQKELPSSLSSSSSSSSTNNSSSIKFWATFFASIVAVTFFGLPLLHRLINKYSSKNKTIDDIQELESMAASGEAGNAASAHRLRAIHDYPSQAEHELTLRQGDVIRVLQKPFELWWEGEIEGQPGRRGLFPSNYTQPI